MYGMAILSIFLSIVLVLQSEVNSTNLPNDPYKAISLAENMITYKSSVANYMTAHPLFTGTIPDSSLSFPAGYVKTQNWTNIASGGYYTVYLPTPTALNVALKGSLSELSEGSLYAGIKNVAGDIETSNAGDTGIPLDPSIPVGAPVYMGTVK